MRATTSTSPGRLEAFLAGILGAGLLWAYWPTLGDLERRWAQDPRYSHGYLVPAFVLFLLRARRGESRDRTGSSWPGLFLIAAAAAVRLAGAYYYYPWFDAFSLVCSILGLGALVEWPAPLRRAWPALAFLVFMVPLPYQLEKGLGSPLQRTATVTSTYVLQLLGLPAFRLGDTIQIHDFQIGVVEACNGLGMSYMFLACAVAVILMVRLPLVDRLILVGSAIPIALIANVCRIVTTGVLHVTVGAHLADKVCHDLAGWIMMPFAVGCLFLEYRLFSCLWLDPLSARPAPAAGEVEPAEPAVPVEPAGPKTRRTFVPPLLAAFSIVIAAGVVQGDHTNRWTRSSESLRALANLERLPMTIGAWSGRRESVDPRDLRSAGLDGFMMRRYENSETGKAISLLIVCGRPGPVSVHTPDICYTAVGYKMAQQEPDRVSVPSATLRTPAEFLRADFEKQGALPPEQLRIYWAWGATGTWSVPVNPRLSFASQPFLYKMYVVQRTAEARDPLTEEAFTDFFHQLMPALQSALFEPPAPPREARRDTPDRALSPL